MRVSCGFFTHRRRLGTSGKGSLVVRYDLRGMLYDSAGVRYDWILFGRLKGADNSFGDENGGIDGVGSAGMSVRVPLL